MTKEIKKSVKKEVGRSKGLLIGLIGLAIFIASIFLVIIISFLTQPGDETIYFFIVFGGFLLMSILALIGFIISIKDYKDRRKLSLAGIIVNIILLAIFVIMFISLAITFFTPINY